MKILLTDPIEQEAIDILKKYACVDSANLSTTAEELKAHARDADIILNRNDTILIDKYLIDAASHLKMIARSGSGYNNVDVEYASSKNIIITNTAGANAVTVAEFTMALILSSARKLISAYLGTKKGLPDRTAFRGFELKGKTLGVIGYGKIGFELAKRAQAFGMNILVCSRRRIKDLTNAEQVGLTTLLKQSDVVSLHVPLTKETINLITAKELVLMKPTAVLINMARGKVVNEKDLIQAMQSNKIAYACLDTIENEPNLACEPLLACDNILVTPHIGAQTNEAQLNNALVAVEEITRFIQGQQPINIVNPEALKK